MPPEYFDVVACVLAVIGWSREIKALRRGSGGLVAHLLRMLAYLMVGAFFVIIANVWMPVAQTTPAGWLVILPLALVAVGIVIFVLTGRSAGFDRRRRTEAVSDGQHARH
jgi:hypothetical protein